MSYQPSFASAASAASAVASAASAASAASEAPSEASAPYRSHRPSRPCRRRRGRVGRGAVSRRGRRVGTDGGAMPGEASVPGEASPSPPSVASSPEQPAAKAKPDETARRRPRVKRDGVGQGLHAVAHGCIVPRQHPSSAFRRRFHAQPRRRRRETCAGTQGPRGSVRRACGASARSWPSTCSWISGVSVRRRRRATSAKGVLHRVAGVRARRAALDVLLHVGARVRVEVVLDLLRERADHVRTRTRRRQRLRLEHGPQRLAEGGARAVQTALERVDRHTEDLRGLRSREPLGIAEEEDLAILVGQAARGPADELARLHAGRLVLGARLVGRLQRRDSSPSAGAFFRPRRRREHAVRAIVKAQLGRDDLPSKLSRCVAIERSASWRTSSASASFRHMREAKRRIDGATEARSPSMAARSPA